MPLFLSCPDRSQLAVPICFGKYAVGFPTAAGSLGQLSVALNGRKKVHFEVGGLPLLIGSPFISANDGGSRGAARPLLPSEQRNPSLASVSVFWGFFLSGLCDKQSSLWPRLARGLMLWDRGAKPGKNISPTSCLFF